MSVSAGVRAITSAFPELIDSRVLMALGFVLLIAWINLRGVRESGTIFSIPTYAFVGGVLLVILIGIIRYYGIFGVKPISPVEGAVLPQSSIEGFAYAWILLRAFAGGCTALTGIEAISDGVRAFKPPEAKNAAQTMVSMGLIAMSLFVGITFLSTRLNIAPIAGVHGESILSQMTRKVTGGGFLYFWVQSFTALILVLAANTGFQDFPRLSSFLARDNFLPRWIQNRGDRLVFSYGIIVLTLLSSVVIVVFRADEISMLPLYAIGVMLSFSFSQAGMSRLYGKVAKLEPGDTLETSETILHYERGISWKRILSVVGSLVTFSVFIILMVTKGLRLSRYSYTIGGIYRRDKQPGVPGSAYRCCHS